jgi:hypothetical protein
MPPLTETIRDAFSIVQDNVDYSLRELPQCAPDDPLRASFILSVEEFGQRMILLRETINREVAGGEIPKEKAAQLTERMLVEVRFLDAIVREVQGLVDEGKKEWEGAMVLLSESGGNILRVLWQLRAAIAR